MNTTKLAHEVTALLVH